MPAKHTIRAKRPSLPPILEIDEDDPSVQLADWPTEFDD